jgi:DNA-binding HxlR family transcriptional regulator
VAALLPGPLRFTDLRRALPGIASNVLTERLRRLELAGLLESCPYSTRPWRAEYRLARSGESLAPAIEELERWAGASRGGRGPVHQLCGATMESRWYCPECEEVVADPSAEEDVVDA